MNLYIHIDIYLLFCTLLQLRFTVINIILEILGMYEGVFQKLEQILN